MEKTVTLPFFQRKKKDTHKKLVNNPCPDAGMAGVLQLSAARPFGQGGTRSG